MQIRASVDFGHVIKKTRTNYKNNTKLGKTINKLLSCTLLVASAKIVKYAFLVHT